MSAIETQSPGIETTEANGPVYIRSHRNYKYSPTMRARPGSFLRIKPDGTVSYHNPNCLKDAKPGSRPFRMPALNPRTDNKPGETFERLKAAIDKRKAKDPQQNVTRFISRPCADGWKIETTDGHTALLTRGPAEGPYCNVFDAWKEKARLVCSIDNPEFHLALKRALVMADANESHKVRLVARPGTLELSSEDPQLGSFDETLTVNTCERWHVTLNGRYLEDVCGSWPLSVWYVDAESAVMFEAEDGSWRYVIMPYKESFDPYAEDAAKVETAEVPNGPGQSQDEPKAECEHEYDDATMSEVPSCIRCGADAPEELIPKRKYLGISTNTDAQTVHYDYLLARNEEHALELLGDLRPDCIPVSVFTAKELREFADIVDERTPAEIQEAMAQLQKEAHT